MPTPVSATSSRTKPGASSVRHRLGPLEEPLLPLELAQHPLLIRHVDRKARDAGAEDLEIVVHEIVGLGLGEQLVIALPHHPLTIR
jgi:hypothetical protein